MLKHYLRYTQHMAETMKQEVGRCPSEWGVLETPDWVIAALDEYEILQQEAEQIQTMAVEVRQMVSTTLLSCQKPPTDRVILDHRTILPPSITVRPHFISARDYLRPPKLHLSKHTHQ